MPPLALALLVLVARAAQAGTWNVTYTDSGTYTQREYLDQTPTSGDWPAGGNQEVVSYVQSGSVSGTVTATLTWQPASDQTLTTDPPPASVTVLEQAYANWNVVNGANAGTQPAGGAVSDGQGDPVTSTPAAAPYSSQTSTGYKAASVSITNNGTTASGTVTSGAMSATTPPYVSPPQDPGASAGVQFTVTPVYITLSGPTPDGSGKQDILIGQQCQASITGLPTFPTGYTVACLWSISGTTLQKWLPATPATQNASANPQASSELDGPGTTTSETDSWYWNELTQTPETVDCAVTVSPPPSQGLPFIINLPTQDVTVMVPTWTATGSGGYMQVNGADPNYSPNYSLWAGPHGMNFAASVTTPPQPAFGQGKLELVQTITVNDSYDSNGVHIPDPQNGQTGLDKVYPYSNSMVNEPAPMSTEDVPDISLSNSITAATYMSTFTDWLMYEPPGSIQYVPLAIFSWGTHGSATIPPTNAWADYASYNNGSDFAGAVNPTGKTPFTPTNVFPGWKQIITAKSF